MFETLRASILYSSPRLASAFVLALLASLLDWQFLGTLGVDGFGDVLVTTAIHGVGIYAGFTIVALVNRPREPSP